MSFEEELEAQAMSKYPFEVQLRPSIKEIYLEGANFAKDYYVKELAKRDEIIAVAVKCIKLTEKYLTAGCVEGASGEGGLSDIVEEALAKIEELSKTITKETK